MAKTATITNKTIDTSNIKRLIVAGDAYDAIRFTLAKVYDGTDLTTADWYLRFVLNGETTDIISLTAEVSGDNLTLDWTPNEWATSESGVLELQLFAELSAVSAYQTKIATIYVEQTLDVTVSGEFTPSVLEQYLDYYDALADEAEGYRDAAGVSAGLAFASATLAGKWAEEAEDTPVTGSQYSALHHALKAAASALSASGAKTAAEEAQAAAESAAADAAAIYDNFDDRYLGAKASDPATDNDGDALTAGDLYFNTVDNKLKVYTGSAWAVATANAADVAIADAGNRYTSETVEAALQEIAGTGRTTETVKANADAVALRELLANKKTSLADNSDTFYPSQKAVKTVTDAKEALANKVTAFQATPTDIAYPSEKLVKDTTDALDTRVTALERPYQIYGAHYDRTADVVTRLGDAIGKSYTYDVDGAKTTVVSDFDNIAPFAWRRCNLADDLTVNAYYGDVTYAEDGSNGQVMVEIPKLYYWSAKDAVNDTYMWMVCAVQAPGFKVHPAFVRDGVEVDYIYFGAYESALYDASATAYVSDGTEYVYASDMLCSVADLQPISGVTYNLDIVEAREMAQNRGYTWNQQDFLGSSLVQMMFIIEFASLNWQSETAGLSAGITNLASGTGNYSQNTGHTTGLGNSSGWVTIAELDLENGATGGATNATSYRGIENFYGNIWNFVDGLNVNNNLAYYADHGFTSDTATGYTEIGTLANTNGYMSDTFFATDFDFGFLVSSVSGGSATDYFCDYYYQSTSWRIAQLGGSWNTGVSAGGFCWSLASSSAFSLRYVSARLFAWS